MKHATKKTALEIIKETLPKTAYADGTVRLSVMKMHLQGFGTNEMNFILAAMVASGARFMMDEDFERPMT